MKASANPNPNLFGLLSLAAVLFCVMLGCAHSATVQRSGAAPLNPNLTLPAWPKDINADLDQRSLSITKALRDCEVHGLEAICVPYLDQLKLIEGVLDTRLKSLLGHSSLNANEMLTERFECMHYDYPIFIACYQDLAKRLDRALEGQTLLARPAHSKPA